MGVVVLRHAVVVVSQVCSKLLLLPTPPHHDYLRQPGQLSSRTYCGSASQYKWQAKPAPRRVATARRSCLPPLRCAPQSPLGQVAVLRMRSTSSALIDEFPTIPTTLRRLLLPPNLRAPCFVEYENFESFRQRPSPAGQRHLLIQKPATRRGHSCLTQNTSEQTQWTRHLRAGRLRESLR